MESMEELYRQYAQTVYRYSLSLTKDAALAEELTQETFAQAIESIGRFDGSCRLSTWLCAIAKNQWRSYCRKHPETLELKEQDITAPSPERGAVAAEERISLLRQLHLCPEPYREILYLRLFGGLSFREIGEILGKSENWARVTFYRGKEYVKKEICKHGEATL